MDNIQANLNTLEIEPRVVEVVESTPTVEPVKASKKQEKQENKDTPAKSIGGDVTETLDIMDTPKTYAGFQSAWNIFGRKYYKIPLRLINDDIKLLDKNLKKISFDVRTITIEPYDIEIKTYFNENNRGVLKNSINGLIAKVCPKYEHFVNFSTNPEHTYITCASDQDPAYLKCNEINVLHRVFKGGKVVSETPLY